MTQKIARKVHKIITRLGLNYAGLLIGTFFFCMSLTPSLLPRPWLYQGLIGGLLFVVGYGLGSLLSWAWRKLTKKEPSRRVRKYAWIALGVAAPLATAGYLIKSFGWQNNIRQLVGEQPTTAHHHIRVLLIALVVAAILIAVCRQISRLNAKIGDIIAKWVPVQVSVFLAVVVTTLLLFGLLRGVVYTGLVRFANDIYRDTNTQTFPGITQPQNSERSGSPESVVSWDSLGRYGRSFAARGPSQEQLQEFSSQQPVEPIRVYAGVDSAPTIKERAALAVQELERTGAFSRSVVNVIATTGTGWVDPSSVDPLEYMYNGDTAQVAIQYSYLPSWISFVVDKQNATDAGRELFNQVYDRWSQLPEEARPKLVVFGLSLGSFGGQAAFSGEADLRNRTDGALFMGTPNDTLLWADFEKNRQPGSQEILPIYNNGRTIRFMGTGGEMPTTNSEWELPRVLYMQHASDSVVWWSPNLILQKPAWLSEPRGSDVVGNFNWFPFVTFTQVTIDQFFGTSVPVGHGHNYGSAPVEGWSMLIPPQGWTASDTTRLRDIINTYSVE